MIVYGDPAYETTLPTLLLQFQVRLAAANAVRRDCLRGVIGTEEVQAACRTLLIHAGQIEQAVHDAPLTEWNANARQYWIMWAESLTDAAARAFTAAYSVMSVPPHNDAETPPAFSEAFAESVMGDTKGNENIEVIKGSENSKNSGSIEGRGDCERAKRPACRESAGRICVLRAAPGAVSGKRAALGV